MMRRLVVLLLVTAGCGGTTTVATPTTPPTTSGDAVMVLTSPAFTEGGTIPVRYTCDGEDVSPPLRIEGIPADTAVLVVVMDDPDAPGGTWDHWVAYDIPVVEEIPEGADDAGVAGRNSWDEPGYRGPCPPGGTHRYVFAVYALSAPTGLAGGAPKAEVYEAMAASVLGEARLTGRYAREEG